MDSLDDKPLEVQEFCEPVVDPHNETIRITELMPIEEQKPPIMPQFHQMQSFPFMPFPNFAPSFYPPQDQHNSTSSPECGTSSDYSDNSATSNDSGVASNALTPIQSQQFQPQFNSFMNMPQNPEILQRLYSCYPNNFALPRHPLPQATWNQPVQNLPPTQPRQPVNSSVTAVAETITDAELDERIKVKLSNESLWERFKNIQNEMIITKTGRNLFPKLTFKVSGLEQQNCYLVFLFFRRVSENKFKYTKGRWEPAGKADESDVTAMYPHGENASFPSGQEWMQSDISFAKLKLTNSQDNTKTIKNAIVLKSMHKYRTVLRILRFNPITRQFADPIDKDLPYDFIAVTAYQNHAVTELKIDNNPFAKGFREGGRKRVRSPTSEGPTIKRECTMPPFMMSSILNNQGMFPVNYFNNLPLGFPSWYNYPPFQQY